MLVATIVVFLEEHINRKDCRPKVAPKASRRRFAGNAHGADIAGRSGICLLLEKESPVALKRA